MTTFLLLATSAMSIATSPVIAAEARPAAPVAAQTTDAVARASSTGVTRYCVIEQFTGSRIPHKTCKTRAAWLAENEFDPLAKQ
ncbi:hypothetical protein [Sphingomonas sp. PAMC 26605]|uniref:hypothetical protein n=1 Tax=Sphingomonas sp. PAMC 26605 TaxID=1112214 RepID=UPI00026CA1A8|nr:hypothetical protein [Sphingomonas sp. PAMC 26605]